MNRAVTFTTAPKEYDWLFTTELDPHVGRLQDGAIVRATETGRFWPSQRSRYQEAGYLALGEEYWLRLVQARQASLRKWDQDPLFQTWLEKLGMRLTPQEVELAYLGFQGGRLQSLVRMGEL
jgi:hypothetical protein